MKKSTLLKTGIAGTAIAALCCFTPVLVVLFGADRPSGCRTDARVGVLPWLDGVCTSQKREE